MDEPLLSVTLRTLNGRHAEIDAVGEIDVSTQDLLRTELLNAIDKGAVDLVVDLSGVSFLDSSGLRGMIEALQRGATLRLRRPQPAVQQVFDIVTIPGLTIEP
jgi:anti-sigma B factor antagonist